MGTRGLYCYKWRGKYYIYWNQWDSYPSGLGVDLSNQVPNDPEDYKAWIERKRQEFQKLEDNHEATYLTLTVEKILAGDDVSFHDHDNELGLFMIPQFWSPMNTLFIEYVYVIDLDDERFSCNACEFVKLAHLTKDWISLHTSALFFGDKITVDDCVTTPASQRALLSHDPSATYMELNAGMVSAKSLKNIPDSFRNRPFVAMALETFHRFLKVDRDDMEMNKTAIAEARDQRHEHEFIFREVCFALLCIASCSPQVIRYISRSEYMRKGSRDYILIGNYATKPEDLEFVSNFGYGYHLKGNRPGAAPAETCYWMLDVLILLKRGVDLSTAAGFQDAINSAVAKGKSEGRSDFDIIIFSIGHMILVRVTENGVQHTKCVPFLQDLHDTFTRDSYESDGTPCNEIIAVDEPDGELLDSLDTTEPRDHAFYLLALVFEGAQYRKLRPTGSVRQGVFPNEVSSMIIQHSTAEVRNSCMSVSRAFRDFASEAFEVDKHLLVEHRNGHGLIFSDPTSNVQLRKHNHMVQHYYFQKGPDMTRIPKKARYLPVIGYNNGSAFFQPELAFHFDTAVNDEMELYVGEDVLGSDQDDFAERMSKINLDVNDQNFETTDSMIE